MVFKFVDLNDEIRTLMLEELSIDMQQGNIYISNRLTEVGASIYVDLLINSINNGNESTLARELDTKNCIRALVSRKKKDGTSTMVKSPSNAHLVLAEGEFNRYYIRALCRKIIDQKSGELEVYRAKEVSNSRHESNRLIGAKVDPQKLLQDLRDNIGIDTFLGIPGGPSSGLSVRIV